MSDPKFQNSVKGGKKDPKQSTQMHLKIAEIHDDTVILKNGGLRSVLKTSSVNLNLKSEEEQNAVIYSYQNFLNMLEFPIQIVVRSKKLDLENYIEKLKKIGVKQSNPLLQKQTFEYIEYISRLVEYADIMEKQFYVVIPHDPFGQERKGFLASFLENIFPQDTVTKVNERHRQFEELKKRLVQRVNTVKSGLEGCGLKVQELNTQELIELYYETYNPLTSRSQRFEPEQELALEQDESKEAA
ncbi:hypothetical protein A3J23_02365 [Candidatus Peregrinibacteria bacterium RIFCSPLOWO2_02_FULL_48_14]|nr:MAG: hypothetical protein UY05_C0056G0010 [Candidatus Peregrinibacteria bacterium GW2011_GWA2_47_7]OGJ43831.1 MAG: hypothetical protein A2974_00245 [Candidatus Peregrinibacteria bacterium RIFCSPLOWO2_01_FULL_48_20]OGJ45923.1 MAG: hypothetical protein A3J23_02365 [Candidatus Peregrinibacteria bacterium RIFCSPLOWO2_02_FULL_48_14]